MRHLLDDDFFHPFVRPYPEIISDGFGLPQVPGAEVKLDAPEHREVSVKELIQGLEAAVGAGTEKVASADMAGKVETFVLLEIFKDSEVGIPRVSGACPFLGHQDAELCVGIAGLDVRKAVEVGAGIHTGEGDGVRGVTLRIGNVFPEPGQYLLKQLEHS